MNRSVQHRGLVPDRGFLVRFVLPVLLLVVAASGTGCVTTDVNPISGKTRFYGYTWEQERKLGKDADRQIQKQYGVYDDEGLQRYVETIGRKVLGESHMRRPGTLAKFRTTEFHFRVLDSPVINAFALPGGYVYVTRGLLAHLNNEAQLAVVLGHEIGHVVGRHASKQAAKQKIMQGVLIGGALAGGAAFGGDVGENVLGLGGTAGPLLSLNYSRGNERESDRLGVEYAIKAGYEAAEGAAFFPSLKRKSKQNGRSLPTWQSTHPDPGKRETTVRELAKQWDQKVEGEQNTRNQDVYYDMLEGIVLGANPHQGFTEDNVFYHPELELKFPTPAGWQIQNETSQVALIQPEQEAYVVFRISTADSPKAAATAFAGQEGLTVVERREERVNGHDARRVLAGGRSPKGQALRILAYFIKCGENVYQFRGLTPASRYPVYRPAFLDTMTGFADLTDQSKLTVQATRLAIRPASRAAPFETFVENRALSNGISADDLAIINQLNLDTSVERGRPLKLPK